MHMDRCTFLTLVFCDNSQDGGAKTGAATPEQGQPERWGLGRPGSRSLPSLSI